MAAVATVTALLDMFKRLYIGKDLSNQALRKTPLFRVIPKKDDLVGEGIYIPYNYGLPVGASANFTRASANVKASKVARWFVQRKQYYGFHKIGAEAIYASRGREGAFLSAKEKEINELLKYMGQEIGSHFWGDASGAIGRNTTTVTGASDTINLATPRDAVKFHIGQTLIANSALTGGTNRTDKYEVTSVNRVTGDIGVTRVSGSSDDWGATDYIFVDGNHGTAAENLGTTGNDDVMITGVQAWIPSSDPSTTLMGMTRTDDPVMKAGWRGSDLGSISESARALAAQMGQYFDSAASGLWLSRYNWYRLEQELEEKNAKVIDQRATQVFGTPALMLLTPEGNVPVMADPFCPDTAGFLLDHSSWEIHHMEGLPHMVRDDGLESLRLSDDDGIEVRFRGWMEAVCFRPFTNGRFPIS